MKYNYIFCQKKFIFNFNYFYPFRKLAGVAGMTMDRIPNKNPLATLEEEKKEHQIKVQF